MWDMSIDYICQSCGRWAVIAQERSFHVSRSIYSKGQFCQALGMPSDLVLSLVVLQLSLMCLHHPYLLKLSLLPIFFSRKDTDNLL